MTEGELAGARVRGVDQVQIGDDGLVTLDIRETIETKRGAISADVRGYAVPDPAAPHMHTLNAFALFSTAVADYAEYNSAVVAVGGTVDMAEGTISVVGYAVDPARSAAPEAELAAR